MKPPIRELAQAVLEQHIEAYLNELPGIEKFLVPNTLLTAWLEYNPQNNEEVK